MIELTLEEKIKTVEYLLNNPNDWEHVCLGIKEYIEDIKHNNLSMDTLADIFPELKVFIVEYGRINYPNFKWRNGWWKYDTDNETLIHIDKELKIKYVKEFLEQLKQKQ